MSKEHRQRCSALNVYEWDASRRWEHRETDLHCVLSSSYSGEKLDCSEKPDFSEEDDLVSAQSQIRLIFASANAIRTCDACRAYFTNRFRIPKYWWTNYCRKSNGYFGCQPRTNHIETWTYFEMKQLEDNDHYRWFKLNVFLQWDRSSHQTTVLAFDTPPEVVPRLLELLATPEPHTFGSPFWFYPHLLSEVARIQESAVWTIRDRVRAAEKAALPKGRPNPDYRHLHDIARHAIHVSETLDVASQTIKRLITRHEELMVTTTKSPLPAIATNDDDRDGMQDVHSQLRFFESFVSSMRSRSEANEKRLVNEIQLAFNTVAQHDASTSVQIGLATQADSVTMKSIAFVTLTFLPPTFVSAIFSMSFFDYDPAAGWAISDKFWLYWVFAVPTTVLTALAWYWLRQYSHVTPSSSSSSTTPPPPPPSLSFSLSKRESERSTSYLV